MSWVIREYQPDDFAGCVEVMKSNTPPFFAEHEIEEFISDLAARAQLSTGKQWPYFVLVTNQVVRACGGYYIKTDGNAGLIWGMVHQEEHRLGLGQALFRYRREHMKGKVKGIELDTTPASFGFYEKLGFVKTKTVKDGYEQGIDQVYALLKL